MKQAEWVVVVAQKDLDEAKSRLQLTACARRAVAQAMFQDTVLATRRSDLVCGVVVVVDLATDARTVRAPGVVPLVRRLTDLNAALNAGAERGRAEFPGCHIAAMPGDLPGLRTSELDAALKFARCHGRTFIADRHRRGTTLLTALADLDLDPRFGHNSRLAHLTSGACENVEQRVDSVRHDVDDLDDLNALAESGPHLRAALNTLRRPSKEIT